MKEIRFQDKGGTVRTGNLKGNIIEYGQLRFNLNEVNVLPPTDPTKIICVGFNYEAHLDDPHLEEEMDIPDRPFLFLKTPNSVAGHEDTVVIPDHMPVVDFEAELGVVIGEQCKYVSEENALDVVRGYTCLNDLSNHKEMDDDDALVRVKAFDNAAPMGPVIVPTESVPDDATIELRTNGEVRQQDVISEMIFSVPEIIAEVTNYMTLEPGDVIATGSPAGTGPVEIGDTVEIKIEGIGKLTHYIEAK